MEFHISRAARQKYSFDQTIFTTNGNVIFANLHAGRAFAQHINQVRDAAHHPRLAVQAGQINALGLIDEILHFVVSLYQHQQVPNVQARTLEYVEARAGKRVVSKAITLFTTQFPPVAVYTGRQSVAEYLRGSSDGISHRAAAMEEIVMLWMANCNPAFNLYAELFEDAVLKENSAYEKVILHIRDFFQNQPPFGPDNQNLMDMLRSPAIAVPDSLEGQLEYMRDRWGYLLSHYLMKLLGSLDMLSEEQRTFTVGAGAPGSVSIPLYDSVERDNEGFSSDSDWMAPLVLIAKNTHVWLSQLSQQFNRPINRLDQIPAETLDQLAAWGFSGLWLIGLWERSPASARIKQITGNPEAIASAYSLYDYRIARPGRRGSIQYPA